RGSARRADAAETARNELAPGTGHVHALERVPLGVVPERSPFFAYGLHEEGRVDPRRARHRLAGCAPALVHAARVIEEGVVEVDKKRFHSPLTPCLPSPCPLPRGERGMLP